MSRAEKLLERQSQAVLLTSEVVSEMLSIAPRTLWRWVSEKQFPAPDFRKNERVVRWRKSTVLEWIDANAVTAA